LKSTRKVPSRQPGYGRTTFHKWQKVEKPQHAKHGDHYQRGVEGSEGQKRIRWKVSRIRNLECGRRKIGKGVGHMAQGVSWRLEDQDKQNNNRIVRNGFYLKKTFRQD
jgi:hypothetical protein